MKRQIFTTVFLAALSLGLQEVRAESTDKPGRDRIAPQESGPMEMMAPPPGEMLSHLTRQLGLSDDQQAKVLLILASEREKSVPLMQKLREQRKQLQAAINAEPLDEAAVRATAARQSQTEIELAVSRARVRSRINALLTPEQKARAEKQPPASGRGKGPNFPCCERSDRRPPPPPTCENDHTRDAGPVGEE